MALLILPDRSNLTNTGEVDLLGFFFATDDLVDVRLRDE